MSAQSSPQVIPKQNGRSEWRSIILLLTLGISIGLSAWTYWSGQQAQSDDEVVPVHPSHSHSTNEKPNRVPGQSVTTKSDGPSDRLPQIAGTESSPDTAERVAAKVLLDPFAPLAIMLPPALKPAPAPTVVIASLTAPTLPFQYMGKLEQVRKSGANASTTKGGSNDAMSAGTMQTIVYLARGNDSYSVSAGENIDSIYRFVGIEGDALVFEYLPLAQRQTLPIGP